jgi:hypothetical protein
MKIRLWQLVAVTIIAFGGPMAVSAPAYAGGPVNITSWCRWYYNSNAFNAITVANNVYGWALPVRHGHRHATKRRHEQRLCPPVWESGHRTLYQLLRQVLVVLRVT